MTILVDCRFGDDTPYFVAVLNGLVFQKKVTLSHSMQFINGDETSVKTTIFAYFFQGFQENYATALPSTVAIRSSGKRFAGPIG